jgi:hypothetical protein
MATLLDRLLFAQGNKCFFCSRPLAKAQASVEHLVGRTHGGTSTDGNVVACCRSVNALFGAMTVKEKLRVVLAQAGRFRCPVETVGSVNTAPDDESARLGAVIQDLERRGGTRPRRLKTLASTVNAVFGKRLSTGEVQSLVAALRTQGLIHVNGEAVTYSLPAGDA